MEEVKGHDGKQKSTGGMDKSVAPPLFVLAVLVITLPRMGDGGFLPLDSWVSIGAGMILTAFGFWFLLRGRRGSP